MSEQAYDSKSFYDGLVSNRLIVPAGVQGAFGRSAVFEDVLEHVDQLISKLSKADGAERFTYPPVIDRRILEKVDYLDSFPQLAGCVHSFFGNEREARALSGAIHAGEPWGQLMGQTDVVLNPAACYPVYPAMTGTLPQDGRLITMTNWVYRHEPSSFERGGPQTSLRGAISGWSEGSRCSLRSVYQRAPTSLRIRSSGARARC